MYKLQCENHTWHSRRTENLNKNMRNLKLTIQKPYIAFHQNCRSPKVQQCEDVSACDRYLLPSSDLFEDSNFCIIKYHNKVTTMIYS